MSEGGNPDQYWFCVKHHRVETVDDLCPGKHRMGPYDSREAAANALEIAQARNEEWDEEDERWDEAGLED
ncbi:hypothetical protein BKA08_002792 [Nocardioides marinisabuli]|uniref:SPOR domain-containing protein n=1 Tax=Nocardioides marinisabuli TaxID=419476 RepID=A0A7Y9JT78_9ACTN|nr:hypothetical protein [Nocardioides marinisabuli]NYD58554.1 hypothetical protein [Nocardioides marinisabuli]